MVWPTRKNRPARASEWVVNILSSLSNLVENENARDQWEWELLLLLLLRSAAASGSDITPAGALDMSRGTETRLRAAGGRSARRAA
jgi:hypothetical protein